MKKAIIISLTIIFSLQAYSQITVYGKYDQDKIIPCATIFGTKKISEKIGLTYFALVSEKWAEAQIGLSYSPVEWVSFGLSGGLEQNPALFRMGTSLWLGKGRTSFLVLAEKGDGKKNYWYKATLSYKASENFAFGIRAWRFHGLGPIAKIKIKKLDSDLWLMPAYDLESETKKIMVGIDIKI